MRARNEDVGLDFYIGDWLTLEIKDTTFLKLFELVRGTEFEKKFEKIANAVMYRQEDKKRVKGISLAHQTRQSLCKCALV